MHNLSLRVDKTPDLQDKAAYLFCKEKLETLTVVVTGILNFFKQIFSHHKLCPLLPVIKKISI